MPKRDAFVVRISVEQSHAKRFKPLPDLFLGIGVVRCHPEVAVPFTIERDAIPSQANDGARFQGGPWRAARVSVPELLYFVGPGLGAIRPADREDQLGAGWTFQIARLARRRIEDVVINFLGWVVRNGLQLAGAIDEVQCHRLSFGHVALNLDPIARADGQSF